MAMTGIRNEGGKVVDIFSGKARRPFKGSKPSEDRGRSAPLATPPAMSSKQNGDPPQTSDKPASADACISILNAVAPVSKNLRLKLWLPDKLYLAAEGSSITSEPGKYADALAAYFFGAAPLPAPEELPGYGIATVFKGNSVFCILVDQRRSVIVMEEVRNAMSPGEGSWDSFEGSLDLAAGKSAELITDGKLEGFVIVREGVMK